MFGHSRHARGVGVKLRCFWVRGANMNLPVTSRPKFCRQVLGTSFSRKVARHPVALGMQRDSPCTCFNPAAASFTDKIAFPKEQKCRRGGEIERITPRNLSLLLLVRRSSCRGFLTAPRCFLLSRRRHRLIATVAELPPLACKNRALMHQRQTPAKC